MKVDHLIANVYRTRIRILDDAETETTIERHHGVGVFHREGDVIEASNMSRGLSRASGYTHY